jgi:transcriptional regulator with XRE-family HTH domain
MTRHRVAVAVEVSPDTIGRWERDETAPDVDGLSRLASAYGVSVSSLMGEA